MRKNEEIIKVMLAVERIWKNFPDMRLSQLLTNAVLDQGLVDDIFHIEDKDLVKYLREFDEKHNKQA